MRFRLWPRTLVVQLIAVTAAAVAISNIAVAYWFETSNQQQNEASLNERVLDRASTVLTTIQLHLWRCDPPALTMVRTSWDERS